MTLSVFAILLYVLVLFYRRADFLWMCHCAPSVALKKLEVWQHHLAIQMAGILMVLKFHVKISECCGLSCVRKVIKEKLCMISCRSFVSHWATNWWVLLFFVVIWHWKDVSALFFCNLFKNFIAWLKQGFHFWNNFIKVSLIKATCFTGCGCHLWCNFSS